MGIKNICVYGASSANLDKCYTDAVYALGKEIASRGFGLVFGAGDKGLMGAVARGALDAGGSITGIVPSFFNVDGVLFEHCTELIYTETMRERKDLMDKRSDAFIAAPGGIGTFEEFLEMLTLKQLGRHNKPMVLFNVNGYYDCMLDMIEHAISEGFIKPACRELYHVSDTPADALSYIESYVPCALSVQELKNIQIEKES